MSTTARPTGESFLILLGFAAFWPYVFGYRALWYQIGILGVAIALAMLAVVRWRRIVREMRGQAAFPGKTCGPKAESESNHGNHTKRHST